MPHGSKGRGRSRGGRTQTLVRKRSSQGPQPAGGPPPGRRGSTSGRRTRATAPAEPPPVEEEALEEGEVDDGAAARVPVPAEARSHSRTGGITHLRTRGQTLRSKFMIAFAGVTASSIIILGVVLSWVANGFLFGQAQHKGVELAKMTAQVGRAVLDAKLQGRGMTPAETEAKLRRYLENARTWGDGEGARKSEILAVYFSGLGLSGFGIGPQNTRGAQVPVMESIRVPRLGNVHLPEDIKVYKFRIIDENDNRIPVYRFRVSLNQRDQEGYASPDTAYVTLDMAIDDIHSVRNQLYLIIAITVVVMIMVALFVADRMANNITRPVKILLRDIDMVAAGDLDHQTRPHSKDEIGALALAFDSMTRDLAVVTDELVDQEAEQKRAEYEMQLATEVQQQLLPSQKPEISGYELSNFYKGARGVSGDYFDYIHLDENLWGFIIADVSGKGVPGSMVMAVTRTIVRLMAAQNSRNAADTLRRTNRLIAKQIKRGMFVTAFYAILDADTGLLTFASAGHNPMVIYRAAQKGYELSQGKGIAIGFNEGPLFDKNIKEFQVQLNPGDAFVLYTDGFPEAMNEQHEEFGDERFYKTIALHGHEGAPSLVKSTLEAVKRHAGQEPQSDDLTMIVVRREG